MKNVKNLTEKQRAEIFSTLKSRFEKNMGRHKGMKWASVLARLETHPQKLWALNEMEKTGGEPDVVGLDKKSGEYIFFDCAEESPKGRRSVCYDGEALKARKEFKPKNNAMDMAEAMGIEMLTEEQYRDLQKLGAFDLKTSSWIQHLLRFEHLGALSLPIAVTTMCLSIIMAPHRIMRPGRFVEP